MSATDPLKTAVTSALAGVALFNPLIGSKSVMDFDFDAAEKAVEQEEGGEARKILDTLTSTISALSVLVVEFPISADIDRLLVLARRRDAAIRGRLGAAALHSLLQDAPAVVTGDDWHDFNLCPVCDAQSDQPLKNNSKSRLRSIRKRPRLMKIWHMRLPEPPASASCGRSRKQRQWGLSSMIVFMSRLVWRPGKALLRPPS